MTMIPSIGYFIVAPKLGPKWTHFKEEILANLTVDESFNQSKIDEQTLLEKSLPDIISEFGWSFCFINDNEVFFQNEMTEKFEAQFGDIQLKISEQQFFLLGMIEKEVMKE